ncbi:MAG: hypothetical protein ACFFE8_15025 [Candidatus Heimdallarchaeota archaeon]
MSKEPLVPSLTQRIQRSRDDTEYKTRLAGLGVFVNIIWILSVFVRPVIDPSMILMLGGIAIVITVGTRLQSRNLKSKVAGDVSGGSIVGYVVSWFFVYEGYPLKSFEFVISPGISFTVNQILIYFFVIIFFVWFAIPASKDYSGVIFDLSPLISYFILNFWKLAVVLEILSLLDQLRAFHPYANLIFMTTGVIELILQNLRLFKLPIADIILDPTQLLFKTIEGPLQALKWTFLVMLFLILDILSLDIFSAGLIAFSVTMGMVSLATSLSKIALDSGLIRSRTDQIVGKSKVMIPKMFDELKQLNANDLQEFYRVHKRINVKKKNGVVNYDPGDILLKLPFSHSIEAETGVFLASLKIKVRGSKRKSSKRKKSMTGSSDKPRRGISFSSLHRIPLEDWEHLSKQKQVELVELEIITKELGFETPEEFEKMVEKGIRGAISFQENIRDRIRGVPVTASSTKAALVKLKDKRIELPDALLNQINLSKDQELEIIPGKEEFLFYARIKERKDK